MIAPDMKLILEYRKPNSRWQSLAQELKVTDNNEVSKNIFGYWYCDPDAYSDHESWYDYEDRTKVFVASGFTLAERQCTETVSYCTLSNLYKFEDTGELTPAGVPISRSELKVDPSDVALLSISEYETCLNGVQNILEYEAILAAAKKLEGCGNEVRLFVFRN